jgi:N-methylhydantoinase B
VRLLAEEDVPVNHGCFQPVQVITPEAPSLLNPAFPGAVAVGNTETGQRVTDTVLGALAQALPDKIPAASQGTMNNFTVGMMSDGVQYVYYETIGGGHGAGPSWNGLSGRQGHMTNTLNTPVEALEYMLPIMVLEYGLRDGSGGAGQYHGGDGIRREYQFLEPATITINSERRIYPPYGLQGGEPGATGINRLQRVNLNPDSHSFGSTEEQIIGGKYTTHVEAGDRVIIETPGGGGWGKAE